MKSKYVLGIETSCDDTSVSLVDSSGYVQDLKKWTQDEDHIPFGGIVPERASRNHLKTLVPLIDKILSENSLDLKSLKGIAVTNRPGLQGSLIVGLVTAKTLGLSSDVPVIGVNHLEGHILSPWLYDNTIEQTQDLNIYPQVSLIVSGGHTQLVYIEKFGSYKVLGRTMDDAVGEAIDKFSNVIGLGFPGGPKVDVRAKLGNSKAYDFPKPMMKREGYDFSFSGLKAAGNRKVESMVESVSELTEDQISDLCASYLASAVEVLVFKLERALSEYNPKLFTIVGGVSANSQLREKAEALSLKTEIPFKKAALKFCTDNGAMIGLVGAKKIDEGQKCEALNLKTYARSLPGDFI